MATTPVSLQPHFADGIDPRSERPCQHERLDIVGGALCAVISGAAAWAAIEAEGHAEHDGLARFSHLPHGIPSQGTFRRVFCLPDPAAFPRGFADRIAALAACGVGDRRLVPIDGKTVRRSGRRGRGWGPRHLVSAWAGAHHVSLGPVAVEGQSHEITAIPRLREWLDLTGALVTIDAMGGPQEVAAKIIPGGGDSLLAVKEDPPHLHEGIDACFLAAWETDFAGLEHDVARTGETNRGREEMRECPVIPRPTGLRDAAWWRA